MKNLLDPMRLRWGASLAFCAAIVATGVPAMAAENAAGNLQARFGGSGVSGDSKLRLHSRIGSTAGYDVLAVASRVAAPLGASAVAANAAAAAETQGNVPSQYALYPSRPSPFNPTTQIAFDLPRSGPVEIVVFDIHGRRVQTLVDRQMTAGRHEVVWRPENQASGVYIYRLRSGEFTETRRTVLLK